MTRKLSNRLRIGKYISQLTFPQKPCSVTTSQSYLFLRLTCYGLVAITKQAKQNLLLLPVVIPIRNILRQLRQEFYL